MIGLPYKVSQKGKPKLYKVNRAHQALYDDPAVLDAWLVKQARDAVAADPVTAMFLGSCDPALVALGEAGLRGG